MSMSLCSAEASKDGHRDESSVGYCHASTAAGKHGLCNVSTTKEWFCFFFLIYENRVRI